MINVNDKHDCCGCTGCSSICGSKAITMTADKEGFLYPKVNESLCTDCGLCEKICPIIQRDHKPHSELPLKVYALHNKDANIWKHSSSGGVFTALAQDCISDNGIVYGAEFNDNFIVIHRGETTIDGTLKFQGSKYVQSDLRGVYKEIQQQLRSGRKVLFSGVPCQVEGLKNFLMKPYSNLITVDILCHGVPSPKIFSDYIKFINRYSLGRLEKINMKDKTFGWGYQNLRLFFSGNRTEFNSPISNLWNRIFYDHIANRPSCSACRFTNFQRPGDITIGDFWGIEKFYPEFNSSNGTSLLLVNSNKGLTTWGNVSEQFNCIESNIEECSQSALCHPQPDADDRSTFWNEYYKMGFNKVINNRYSITRMTLYKNGLLQLIKSIKDRWTKNQ